MFLVGMSYPAQLKREVHVNTGHLPIHAHQQDDAPPHTTFPGKQRKKIVKKFKMKCFLSTFIFLQNKIYAKRS